MNARFKEIELKPHKLTVNDHLVLDDGGAFAKLGKVELLDGKLYEASPQKSAHAVAKTELGYRLRQKLDALGNNLALVIEPTIKVLPHSAPEPDIAIMNVGRVVDYFPVEIVKLAVEISSTTLRTDLGYKKALYADAGIPEYWVLDIAAKKLHIFWSPEREDYRDSIITEIGGEIASKTIDDLMVDSSGIL